MDHQDANSILSDIIGRHHTYDTKVTGYLVMLADEGYTYSTKREPTEADYQKAFDMWAAYTPEPSDGSLANNRNAPWIRAGARMIAGGKNAAPTPTPSPAPTPAPTAPGLSDAAKTQLRQHLKAIETIAGL